MRQRGSPGWLKAARRAGKSTDWIGRALARAGIIPPDRLREALTAKRVNINGKRVTDAYAPVAASDAVEVDGARIELKASTRVLAYHKPLGLIVAGHDPEGAGTVFDALRSQLPEPLRRFGWHAVGRLDRATSGLLLFTNDERLVDHVTSPESHLPKRYVAIVDGAVRIEHVRALVEGVMIDDGPARALSAAIRGSREIELVLNEGRHHQVRRMLNAVRLAVEALHREAVGGVTLDLDVGGWRGLSEDEVRTGLRFDLPGFYQP